MKRIVWQRLSSVSVIIGVIGGIFFALLIGAITTWWDVAFILAIPVGILFGLTAYIANKLCKL